MPHQCIHCGTIYDDGDEAILKGCRVCGGKVFFYISQKKLEKMKELQKKLSQEEKKEIEKDVKDLIGDVKEDMPIVLDLETIQIEEPGKYDIDLVKLFKKEGVIYKIEEGKYIIDIPTTLYNLFSKKINEEKK